MEVTPYNIRTTVISPGAVFTELLNQITDPEVAAANRKATESMAVPAE
jgi:NADP-dependent 3-hydroxy acid dehydrogenase YdfG